MGAFGGFDQVCSDSWPADFLGNTSNPDFWEEAAAVLGLEVRREPAVNMFGKPVEGCTGIHRQGVWTKDQLDAVQAIVARKASELDRKLPRKSN